MQDYEIKKLKYFRCIYITDYPPPDIDCPIDTTLLRWGPAGILLHVWSDTFGSAGTHGSLAQSLYSEAPTKSLGAPQSPPGCRQDGGPFPVFL